MNTQPKWRIKLIRRGLNWSHSARTYGAFLDGSYLWGSSSVSVCGCFNNARSIMASGEASFCRDGKVA